MRIFKFYIIISLLGFSFNVLASGEVKIGVKLWPAGDFIAKTQKIKGGPYKTGPDSWIAKNIILDLKSLKTGIEIRDNHLRDTYFEVGKRGNSVATLVSAMGKGGKFKGKLQVHGVTGNISGSYSIQGNFLVANFKTKSSGYSIKKGEYMGVGAEDEVTVEVKVAFTQIKPSSKKRRRNKK